MAYSIEIINSAKNLRKLGKTLNEIAGELAISKSTVSLWVRDVPLSKKAKLRLELLREKARVKSAETKAKKREKIWMQEYNVARLDVTRVAESMAKRDWRIMAAILYWCEGEKKKGSTLVFTNSDPEMVRTFLKSMRNGFNVNENRLKALVHVHEYHDKNRQRTFWS